MKLLFVFACLVGISLAATTSSYTRKYDDVDVDAILSNNRILTNYIKCMMDKGPCTPDGKELKKSLPDALANGCKKCTSKQKSQVEKVFRFLTEKRSQDWNNLANKYDPTGEYKKKYEAQFAKEKKP